MNDSPPVLRARYISRQQLVLKQQLTAQQLSPQQMFPQQQTPQSLLSGSKMSPQQLSPKVFSPEQLALRKVPSQRLSHHKSRSRSVLPYRQQESASPISPSSIPVSSVTQPSKSPSDPYISPVISLASGLPLLSAADHDQLISCLLDHALLHDHHRLTVRLADLRPGLLTSGDQSERRQLLLLRASLTCLGSARGPLPEIMDQVFVSSLLESVSGLVSAWPQLTSSPTLTPTLSRLDLAQLVTGLRFITLLTVLQAPDRFTYQNVLGLLSAYFPLPESAGWPAAWQRQLTDYQLETASEKEHETFYRVAVSTARRANRYIQTRLRGTAAGPAEREKDRTESVLGLWRDISPLVGQLAALLTKQLGSSSSPLDTILIQGEEEQQPAGEEIPTVWLPFLRQRLGDLSEDNGEDRLLELVSELEDMRLESMFWQSYPRLLMAAKQGTFSAPTLGLETEAADRTE